MLLCLAMFYFFQDILASLSACLKQEKHFGKCPDVPHVMMWVSSRNVDLVSSVFILSSSTGFLSGTFYINL